VTTIVFRKHFKIALAVMFSWAFVAGAFVAQRNAQLSKLDRLIGEWTLSAKLLEPPELAEEFKGWAKFSWDLNKKVIRVEGELGPEGQKIRGLGMVTFDDSGSEEAHRYRATLAWDADGRIVALEGSLVGDILTMTGMPLASDGTKDVRFGAKTEFRKEKMVVTLDVQTEEGPVRFMVVSLTRKPSFQR
jgi:hypothetical protein